MPTLAEIYQDRVADYWGNCDAAGNAGDDKAAHQAGLEAVAEAERKACAEVARRTDLPSRHVVSPGNAIAAAILSRRAMMDALIADGEKLKALTGEDHGPESLDARLVREHAAQGCQCARCREYRRTH